MTTRARRVATDDLDLPLVFRGADALEAGVLTQRELRDGRWVRLLRGVYTRRDVEVTHPLRCEAAGLLLPPAAQITGASAASVLGQDWLAARDDVEAVIEDVGLHPTVRGVSTRRSRRPLDRGRAWRTTQLAAPERIAFDAAARTSLPWAVARLDALVRARLVTVPRLEGWLLDRRDGGVVRVREAVAMVDPRAESLPESVVRVLLHLAGIDAVPQVEVRHMGRFVGRVDLALVALRIAVEYDGAWHALPEQLVKDRDRLNALREAGWVVVHVTAADVAEPGRVVALVRAAMAGRSHTGRDTWPCS
ncbi:endonuclease domain-containing protein [Pseudokineococcus sp. 1T1Z-3]|uniref:endonuclease domain-containing protein n=1 Tax=Pseudokineococcus sp. 1T1Z-3 TaxID=3132745 RepID=UPI003094F243